MSISGFNCTEILLPVKDNFENSSHSVKVCIIACNSYNYSNNEH